MAPQFPDILSAMKFFQALGATLVFASALPVAHAKKTGFLDAQQGIIMGIANYQYLSGKNAHDPVPFLAATGTETSGSAAIQFIPIRAGLFITRGNAEVETYLRYMIAQKGTWAASGGQDGAGTTAYKSIGAGINAGVAIYQLNSFQLKTTLNAEYVMQKASLTFEDSVGTDKISLGTNSLLAGAGLQPELWLGDQWVLSLFAGYQYGFEQPWNVSKDTSFMGRTHSQGALLDGAGDPATARFGGFLIEIALKLNFQM